MPGLIDNDATLYRRLADDESGIPQRQQITTGTLRACASYLRERHDEDSECVFAELADGTRLSAVELDRIVTEEGG